MTLSAAVIGLGKVGMALQTRGEEENTSLTHCQAIHRHSTLKLVAGVDLNSERRDEFENRFREPSYGSVQEMKEAVRPDIAVIASPTSTHAEVLSELFASHQPSLVLMEKPTSFSESDDSAIRELAEQFDGKILVNFIRRTDESFADVAALLQKNFRLPVDGVCWYSSGLFNSASHFLDLLFGWFGPLRLEAVSRNPTKRDEDWDAEFLVGTPGLSVRFIPVRQGGLTHSSIELLSTSGRLIYDRGGEFIALSERIPHPVLPGYEVIGPVSRELSSNLRKGMDSVYEDVVRQAGGNPGALPSIQEALAVNALLLSVIAHRKGLNR